MARGVGVCGYTSFSKRVRSIEIERYIIWKKQHTFTSLLQLVTLTSSSRCDTGQCKYHKPPSPSPPDIQSIIQLHRTSIRNNEQKNYPSQVIVVNIKHYLNISFYLSSRTDGNILFSPKLFIVYTNV